MHRIAIPTALHKGRRQPIKQLRMRRLRAVFSEIRRGAYQPFAKVMLPNTVHLHTRRERMPRRKEPAGKVQSV